MTNTARKLIEELRRLPDDEQEATAASLLADLRKRNEASLQEATRGEQENGERLYETFRVLKDAKLQLAPDASATYEQELYGREGRSDEA